MTDTQGSAIDVETEGNAMMSGNNKPTKGILRRDGNYDPNIPVFMQVPKKVKIAYEQGAYVEDQTKEDEI